MEPSVPLLAALMLGVAHALETDHVAAVTAFVGRRPGPRAAVAFGLRWAAGHGAAVVIGGTALLVAALRVPMVAEVWLERLVGLSLVLLGCWTIASGRTLHAHRHTHEDGTRHTHLHGHLDGDTHEHGHAATLVGLLHGLAGAAPAVAVVPLVRLDSPWLGTGFLVVFAAGTAIAMALYALLAGWIAGRAAVRSAVRARALGIGSGIATIGVGAYWLAAA